MAVPFFDLRGQHASLAQALEEAMAKVLHSGAFILGPAVEAFEQHVAEYLGVGHAVGVSSGTDALIASLLATGIGPGDEVVTTSFSFFATAEAILRVGARPVFVDIEPGSYHLDLARIEEVLSPRVRAILPVHLFGRAQDLGGLLAMCRERKLAVIEDAAQALGARDATGRLAGTTGSCGCFSFFPSKNLGGAGDGGLVVTGCAERAARLRQLRVHGAGAPHLHEAVGGNFRLDTLQAALLSVKLPHVDTWAHARRSNADAYRRLLAEAGLVAAGEVFPRSGYPVALPPADEGHSYNQFVIRVEQRDGLARHLKQRGVGFAIYYPRPLHRQPVLAGLGYEVGFFPEAERAASEVLALPIFPGLTDGQIRETVAAIQSYFA